MRVREENNYYSALPDCPGELERDYNADVKVSFRPFDADDTKFVMHSWMRSYRKTLNEVTEADYYLNMQEDIKKISQTARVLVACDSDKPWFILGYIVTEPLLKIQGTHQPLVCYYCFVKNAYRRKGIATALIEEVGYEEHRGLLLVYWTWYCKQLKTKFRLRHNPWLVHRDRPPQP